LTDQLKLAQQELTKRKARQELQRRSLIHFTSAFTNGYTPGWVHYDVANRLEAFAQAVRERKSPRLMIFLPPRAGKSQLVSRCFPAYFLGHNPEFDVICATYGQDLADDMGRYVRSILNDQSFIALFPDATVATGSNAADRIDLARRGSYRAVGRGSSLTGRGSHVLIIDDPIKDADEADSATIQEGLRDWYLTTARTRLAPGGGVIIVQTLWSLNDLPFCLLDAMKEDEKADKWMVYKYPAIATMDEAHRKKGEALHPERFPIDELERTRATFYSAGKARWWNSLYQQNPTAEEGNFFKKDWFQRYAPKDLPPKLNWYADKTAIFAFGVDPQHNIYVHPKIIHERLSSLEAVNAVLLLAKEVGAKTIAGEKGIIESAIGPLVRMRMNEMRFWPQLWTFARSQGKHIYASVLAGRMQQRKVYFPGARIIDEELIPEFLSFLPAADNPSDNLVDGLTNGMMMLDELLPAPAPAAAPENGPHPWSYEGMAKRTPHLQPQRGIRSLRGTPYKTSSQSKTGRADIAW
jgi:hypothetical protein